MRPLRLELLFPFQGYSLLLHPEQQLRNQKSPKALPHTTQSPRPKGAGQQKLHPTKPGYDRPGPAPPPPYRSSPNPVSQILMDTPPLHSKAAKGRHTNQAVMIWLRHYQSNPRGRAPSTQLVSSPSFPLSKNTPDRNRQCPHTSTQPVPVHSQSHTRRQAAEDRRVNIAATSIFSSRRAYVFSAKPTPTRSENPRRTPFPRPRLSENKYLRGRTQPPRYPHAKDTQITPDNKGSLTPWKDRLSPVPQTPTILPRNPRR